MIRRPPRSTLFPLHDALPISQEQRNAAQNVYRSVEHDQKTGLTTLDRKSGSAGMPRPISYAVFCLKKKMHAIASYTGRASSAYTGGGSFPYSRMEEVNPALGS